MSYFSNITKLFTSEIMTFDQKAINSVCLDFHTKPRLK